MANGLVLIAIARHGRNPLLNLHGLPRLRHQRPPPRAPQLLLQLQLRRLPQLHGLGSIYDFDPAKTITDWSKPLLDGAMGPGSGSAYLLRLIKLAAEKYKIDIRRPFEDLTTEQQNLFLYGPPRNEAGRTGFHGIFNYLRANLEDTNPKATAST